ncbi:unnamed protein product [Amoebophrya sp. A120]|nr:unnamed protein product [Amoebophrya sp. A120]|eukprot:GSA120T00006820001.1
MIMMTPLSSVASVRPLGVVVLLTMRSALLLLAAATQLARAAKWGAAVPSNGRSRDVSLSNLTLPTPGATSPAALERPSIFSASKTPSLCSSRSSPTRGEDSEINGDTIMEDDLLDLGRASVSDVTSRTALGAARDAAYGAAQGAANDRTQAPSSAENDDEDDDSLISIEAVSTEDAEDTQPHLFRKQWTLPRWLIAENDALGTFQAQAQHWLERDVGAAPAGACSGTNDAHLRADQSATATKKVIRFEEQSELAVEVWDLVFTYAARARHLPPLFSIRSHLLQTEEHREVQQLSHLLFDLLQYRCIDSLEKVRQQARLVIARRVRRKLGIGGQELFDTVGKDNDQNAEQTTRTSNGESLVVAAPAESRRSGSSPLSSTTRTSSTEWSHLDPRTQNEEWLKEVLAGSAFVHEVKERARQLKTRGRPVHVVPCSSHPSVVVGPQNTPQAAPHGQSLALHLAPAQRDASVRDAAQTTTTPGTRISSCSLANFLAEEMFYHEEHVRTMAATVKLEGLRWFDEEIIRTAGRRPPIDDDESCQRAGRCNNEHPSLPTGKNSNRSSLVDSTTSLSKTSERSAWTFYEQVPKYLLLLKTVDFSASSTGAELSFGAQLLLAVADGIAKWKDDKHNNSSSSVYLSGFFAIQYWKKFSEVWKADSLFLSQELLQVVVLLVVRHPSVLTQLVNTSSLPGPLDYVGRASSATTRVPAGVQSSSPSATSEDVQEHLSKNSPRTQSEQDKVENEEKKHRPLQYLRNKFWEAGVRQNEELWHQLHQEQLRTTFPPGDPVDKIFFGLEFVAKVFQEIQKIDMQAGRLDERFIVPGDAVGFLNRVKVATSTPQPSTAQLSSRKQVFPDGEHKVRKPSFLARALAKSKPGGDDFGAERLYPTRMVQLTGDEKWEQRSFGALTTTSPSSSCSTACSSTTETAAPESDDGAATGAATSAHRSRSWPLRFVDVSYFYTTENDHHSAPTGSSAAFSEVDTDSCARGPECGEAGVSDHPGLSTSSDAKQVFLSAMTQRRHALQKLYDLVAQPFIQVGGASTPRRDIFNPTGGSDDVDHASKDDSQQQPPDYSTVRRCKERGRKNLFELSAGLVSLCPSVLEEQSYVLVGKDQLQLAPAPANNKIKLYSENYSAYFSHYWHEVASSSEWHELLNVALAARKTGEERPFVVFQSLDRSCRPCDGRASSQQEEREAAAGAPATPDRFGRVYHRIKSGPPKGSSGDCSGEMMAVPPAAAPHSCSTAPTSAQGLLHVWRLNLFHF